MNKIRKIRIPRRVIWKPLADGCRFVLQCGMSDTKQETAEASAVVECGVLLTPDRGRGLAFNY
jgi:hypothetical protein